MEQEENESEQVQVGDISCWLAGFVRIRGCQRLRGCVVFNMRVRSHAPAPQQIRYLEVFAFIKPVPKNQTWVLGGLMLVGQGKQTSAVVLLPGLYFPQDSEVETPPASEDKGWN